MTLRTKKPVHQYIECIRQCQLKQLRKKANNGRDNRGGQAGNGLLVNTDWFQISIGARSSLFSQLLINYYFGHLKDES